MNKQRLNKMIITAAVASVCAVAVLAAVSRYAHAEPAAPIVKPLADRYDCEEGQVLIVDGDTATFNGKEWGMAAIYPTSSYKEDGRTYLTTQYDFIHGNETFAFVTGQGKPQQGALMLPDSDSWLFCKATKGKGSK